MIGHASVSVKRGYVRSQGFSGQSGCYTCADLSDAESVVAGQLIASRYRIEGRLGAGGMGVVYRAVDEHLHRPIAIKLLPPAFQDNPDRLGQFRNEARTLTEHRSSQWSSWRGRRSVRGCRQGAS